MKLRNILSAALLTAALSLSAKAPKYIFYFIGDGMGPGAVAMTQAYNRMVLGSDSVLTMMQFPVASLAFTQSASSPVTDSAAAGTALSTGHKTNNGMLGVTPDTVAVTSIAKVLHDNGYGIGLITTVAPDDATPAAFYAHQPHRSMFYEIGCDAAHSGYEFLAGASWRGETKDGQPTDLPKVFKDNKVDVVKGLDALAKSKSRRVVLLAENPFSSNDIGFVVDSIPGQMSLLDMTKAGVDHMLRHSPDKFFMMVEGGSIDHAGHSNDAAAVVMETFGFDQALAYAYDFYRAHPDETLIVVTADHETGGLVLANPTYHYNIEPKYLAYPSMSKDKFIAEEKAMLRSRMVIGWDDMKQLLSDKLGFYGPIAINDEQNKQLEDGFEAVLKARAEGNLDVMNRLAGDFAEDVYKVISSVSGTGWTTHDHSGLPVPVFAVGVDAQRFSQMQDNTDIPKTIISIAELSL